MQGWYYVESVTGQQHDRVQTESQELQRWTAVSTLFGLVLNKSTHSCWVIDPVHTTQEKFKNAALRKRSFLKTHIKPEGFKNAGFLFSSTRDFENSAIRKRWCDDNHVISRTEFSSNTSKYDRWLLWLQISPVWCGRRLIHMITITVADD